MYKSQTRYNYNQLQRVVSRTTTTFRPINRHALFNSGNIRFRRELSTRGDSDNEDALRILFCGSDSFSCAALRSLHDESLAPSSNIASIDVVCRKGKGFGRGLKSIRHPEVKETALALGLPVHQIDTFTGWEPPNFADTNVPHINLIIAVSFGLKVPPRILSRSRFSGINLHPSLLPLYKGPAPLRWILMNGEKWTGMTLQTLHPTSFDEGVILDQTPWPGIKVPEKCDHQKLLGMMQAVGSEMLVNAVRRRLYRAPHKDVGWAQSATDLKEEHARAPKTDASHRLIGFSTMPSSRILGISRAFESTWAMASVTSQSAETKRIRVIFRGSLQALEPRSKDSVISPEVSVGLPYRVQNAAEDPLHERDRTLSVNTIDGKTLKIETIQVEGGVEMPAYDAALKYRLLGQSLRIGSSQIVPFHEPLS